MLICIPTNIESLVLEEHIVVTSELIINISHFQRILFDFLNGRVDQVGQNY
jgi:hypothetical protein